MASILETLEKNILILIRNAIGSKVGTVQFITELPGDYMVEAQPNQMPVILLKYIQEKPTSEYLLRGEIFYDIYFCYDSYKEEDRFKLYGYMDMVATALNKNYCGVALNRPMTLIQQAPYNSNTDYNLYVQNYSCLFIQ